MAQDIVSATMGGQVLIVSGRCASTTASMANVRWPVRGIRCAVASQDLPESAVRWIYVRDTA